MSGLSLVTFQQPDELMNPENIRGKLLYGEEAAKNGLTLSDYQAVITGVLRSIGILTAVTLSVSLLGVGLLLARRRSKRLIITILLLSALLQAATMLISAYLIPADVGFVRAWGRSSPPWASAFSPPSLRDLWIMRNFPRNSSSF